MKDEEKDEEEVEEVEEAKVRKAEKRNLGTERSSESTKLRSRRPYGIKRVPEGVDNEPEAIRRKDEEHDWEAP